MTSRNVARRLEQVEERLLPANEEPLVIRIISVSPDGERSDSGVEFTVPPCPQPPKERWR